MAMKESISELLSDITLILLGLICTISFFLYDGTEEYAWFRQILAGSGTLIIILWLILSRIHMLPAQKNLVQSMLQLFMGLLLLGSSNLLFVQFDTRIDLTESQHHTLSAQSKAIISSLQEPINILAFVGSASPEEIQIQSIIDAFQAETKQMHVSYIDPNQDPMLAKQYEVSNLAEIVIEQGNQKRKIDSFFTEERIVQEILSISKGTTHQICFTTGHQELILEQYEKGASMRLILDKLEAQNYQAKIINLLQQQEIPSTCTTLVIAGPQFDFAPFEVELIAAHVAQGKHLYALLDVGSTPTLASSFSRYGILLPDNAILEVDPKKQVSGGDYSYAVINTTDFAPHPTAKTLATNILLQGIRSVVTDDNNTEQSLLELAFTSTESWAETEYQNGPIEKTNGVDILGPVPVIAIVEVEDPESISIGTTHPDLPNSSAHIPRSQWERKKGAKIIVVGSSSLVLDEFTQRGDLGNLDLFLNGISWMNDESEQLYTRSKTQNITPFFMNPNQVQIIMLVSLILTPATILLGAFNTWYWKEKSVSSKVLS